MREDLTLVPPVHLGLRAWDHLEPAVQEPQLVRGDTQLGRDPGTGLLQIQLDALIVAGEPVLLDQPLVNNRAFQQQL
ncbi:hypothetical protein [Kibdelosporangium philippinense]|uniref:hypothetical protein n=1 Tax=Kibdelosporangium philippinense TaxID=211113 RepID=UPI00361FF7D4